MNNIKVLDCTLRDGGYVNNWNFGKLNIIDILNHLLNAQVDIVECGFLSQKKETSDDKSIYRNICDLDKLVCSDNFNSEMVVMVNYGEYDIDDLPQYNNGVVKGIRLAFHKKDFHNALKQCKEIKEKGYDVFVQPMVTLTYTEEEIKELVELTNEILPKVLYIVDSFGTMTKSELLRLYDSVDSKLDKDIAIGFHSHNNMQLSFSNAQLLMELDTDREIYIDSSVYGMGRGAGNLCTELITKYLNDNYSCSYDLIPILEIIDDHLMNIFLTSPWGYSVPYYIASINNCHPNYASYLLDKQSISVKDIHKILHTISESKKNFYDKNYIEELYINYQKNTVNDDNALIELKSSIGNSEILLLAPGKSLKTQKNKIEQYVIEKRPIIISVNFITDIVPVDMVFIGNLKRFSNIEELLNMHESIKKVIITSNIKTEKQDKVLTINYSDYLSEDSNIADNSGMMVLNLLKKIGVSSVALAGFDGFSLNRLENYYSDNLVNSASSDELILKSEAISQRLKQLEQVMNIEFVTDSLYKDKV